MSSLFLAISLNILFGLRAWRPIWKVLTEIVKRLSSLVGAAFFQDFRTYFVSLLGLFVWVSAFLLVLSVVLLPWSYLSDTCNFSTVFIIVYCLSGVTLLNFWASKIHQSTVSYRWPIWEKLFLYFFMWDIRVLLGLGNLFAIRREKKIRTKPVFLLSVARQGSTAVAEYVCQTYDVGYHKYGDSPFFGIPELSKVRKLDFVGMDKRLHLDNLTVSSNSPDAFDEPFLTYFDQGDIRLFVKWFKSLLSRLSKVQKTKFMFFKNNNNWLRYDRLKQIEGAKFVALVRDPKQTVRSLQRNHEEFVNLAETDSFFNDYLKMVGHVEFGPHFDANRYLASTAEIRERVNETVFFKVWINFAQFLLSELKKESNNIQVIFAHDWVGEIDSLMATWKVEKRQSVNAEFALAAANKMPPGPDKKDFINMDYFSESHKYAMALYYEIRELTKESCQI